MIQCHYPRLHHLELNCYIYYQESICLGLSDWLFVKWNKATTRRSLPSPLISAEQPVTIFWAVYTTGRSTLPFEGKTDTTGLPSLLPSNKTNAWLLLILRWKIGFSIVHWFVKWLLPNHKFDVSFQKHFCILGQLQL